MKFKLLRRYGGGGGKCPPTLQKSLPPFDPSDDWGLVHTTQPPDLILPTSRTRDFMLFDLGGVMLPSAPPFVDGANTTPPEMTMSFLLPKYQQPWIDNILCAHATRSYPCFLLGRRQADDAGMSDAQFCDLIEYVQSWGFYVLVWLSSSRDNRSGGWNTIGGRINQFLDVLLARSQHTLDNIASLLPGQELNNGCPPGPGGADDIIANVCARVNPTGIPVDLHFTANYPGYPVNVPPDQADAEMVHWIAQWKGRVRGLFAQMDAYNPVCKIGGVDRPYGDPSCYNAQHGAGLQPLSSAGYMGAKLWDIRRFWARAGYNTPSIYSSELINDAQLYGKCSEEYGCLRGLEMLYCTSDGSCPPLMGTGGCRLPDGRPLLTW